MTTVCPHCGFDLAKDEVIERGEMHFEPLGEVRWRGSARRLTQAQRIVLSALLKADGRCVSSEAIVNRLGYEGDRPQKLVHVYISRLRKLLPGAPIKTVHWVGWRWAA